MMENIHVQKLVRHRGERLQIQIDKLLDDQRPRIATRAHHIHTFEESTTRKRGDVERGTSRKSARVAV